MNVSEEKEHIYTLMRDITAERRELTELYYSLKKRLDELNQLEQRGLTDLSVKGYVDLHNEKQKRDSQTAINNIKREFAHATNKIEKEEKEREKEVSPPKDEPKFKKEIQEEKNRKKSGKPSSSSGRVSIEHMISIISNVLKEYGAPMHISVLHEKVNEKLEDNEKVTMANFRNNTLYRISKRDTRIERPSRGYYQYRF